MAANVTETEVLLDFRAGVCNFGDKAKNALITIDCDIRRTYSFLDEQMNYWKTAERQAEDEVVQAKTELSQRRMQRIGDRKPDTSEQEKALRRALARLECAQEKLAATRGWLREFPHELTNYEGPAKQLQNALETDVPRLVVFLDRKIAALESYLDAPVR